MKEILDFFIRCWLTFWRVQITGRDSDTIFLSVFVGWGLTLLYGTVEIIFLNSRAASR